MGSFNISCALSGLTMHSGDEALMLLIGIPIKESHHDSGTVFPTDLAQALTYHFLEGEYYDYAYLKFKKDNSKLALKNFNKFTGLSTIEDYKEFEHWFRKDEKPVYETPIFREKMAIHPMYIRKDVFQVALDIALYDEQKAIEFFETIVAPEMLALKDTLENGTEEEKMRCFLRDLPENSTWKKNYYKIRYETKRYSDPIPCYEEAYLWGWNFDSYRSVEAAQGIRAIYRHFNENKITLDEARENFLASAKYTALVGYMRLMNCVFRMSCYAGQEHENKEQAAVFARLAAIGNKRRDWEEDPDWDESQETEDEED